jgi:PhnB protein
MPQKATKPIPDGINTVTPYLVFTGNCSEAIDFYQKALGAKLVYAADKSPDGKVMHATLKIGDSNIMLSDTWQKGDGLSGLKSNLWLYVDDADVFYNRAVKAGCEVVMKMADAFWGDRLGEVRDPFGHTWNFATRKWVLTPEEVKDAEAKWLKSAGY